MMRILAVVALFGIASATTERRPSPDSRHCLSVNCQTRETFETDNCAANQRAQKIFQAGVMDDCCATFKCVTDPNNPCDGVTCKVANSDIAAQSTWCNDNIYPDDPIWNNLQVEYGTLYAFLVRKAQTNVEGRCCDDFKCKVDATALCENRKEKTPCPTEATCPLCHSAVVRTPADPENGQCCDQIACVPDPVCMCTTTNGGGNAACPEPTCDEVAEGFALQYPVTLYEASPSEGRCCPIKTCQEDVVAICNAERTRIAWDSSEAVLCPSACEDLQIIEEEDLLTGKCFPTYKCIPSPDVCCGFDTTTCAPMPTDEGLCESYEVETVADPANGPCCDQYKLVVDQQCVCDTLDTAAGGDACPYADADAYRTDVCPETLSGGAAAYTVTTTPANPADGRCCPNYKCVKTSEKLLQDLRANKPKATISP